MRFIRDLTFDTAKLLNRIYKESRHYQVRQRAHCILLSYKGVTIPELIEFFQVSRRTIYNWMNDWEERRLLGLYNRKGRGRKAIFNEGQKQKIKEWVKLYPKDLKKVLNEIQEEWGITVSKDTIKRVLRSMSMTWRRFQRGLAGEPDPLEYKEKEWFLRLFYGKLIEKCQCNKLRRRKLLKLRNPYPSRLINLSLLLIPSTIPLVVLPSK